MAVALHFRVSARHCGAGKKRPAVKARVRAGDGESRGAGRVGVRDGVWARGGAVRAWGRAGAGVSASAG